VNEEQHTIWSEGTEFCERMLIPALSDRAAACVLYSRLSSCDFTPISPECGARLLVYPTVAAGRNDTVSRKSDNTGVNVTLNYMPAVTHPGMKLHILAIFKILMEHTEGRTTGVSTLQFVGYFTNL
jgi:hypothetical protein